MDAEYFEIKNYAQFQHYSKRNPPWIRLYRSVLDDPEFIALDEVSRCRYLLLTLVASTCDNRIKNDASFLQKMMRLEIKPDLTALFDSGFLLASRKRRAIKPLAMRKQKFVSETDNSETETDNSETETDNSETDAQRTAAPEAPADEEWLIARFDRIPGVLKTKTLTGACRTVVKARLQEHPSRQWWEELFTTLIEPSDFLCGRVKDFRASLPWICGPKNLSKILAGMYRGKGGGDDWEMKLRTVRKNLGLEETPV